MDVPPVVITRVVLPDISGGHGNPVPVLFRIVHPFLDRDMQHTVSAQVDPDGDEKISRGDNIPGESYRVMPHQHLILYMHAGSLMYRRLFPDRIWLQGLQVGNKIAPQFLYSQPTKVDI